MKKIITLIILLILLTTGCSNGEVDRSCETDKDCVCNCDCGCFNVNDHCDGCEGWGPWEKCTLTVCSRGPGEPTCVNNTCQGEY